jgi:hypothetical protein
MRPHAQRLLRITTTLIAAGRQIVTACRKGRCSCNVDQKVNPCGMTMMSNAWPFGGGGGQLQRVSSRKTCGRNPPKAVELLAIYHDNMSTACHIMPPLLKGVLAEGGESNGDGAETKSLRSPSNLFGGGGGVR